MSWKTMRRVNERAERTSTSRRSKPSVESESCYLRAKEEREVDQKLRSVLQTIVTAAGITIGVGTRVDGVLSSDVPSGFGSPMDLVLSAGLVLIAVLVLHPDVF